MGSKKQLSVDIKKKIRKAKSMASLKDTGISARKMSLIANLIRGRNVNDALNILTFTRRASSTPMKKLLLSAIANWEAKNTNQDIENVNLIISELMVNKARMLKRRRTAPQGRSHMMRKRSSHVHISLTQQEK